MNATGGGASPPRNPPPPRHRDVGGIVLVLGVVAVALTASVVTILVAPDTLCNCPEVGVDWVSTTPASVTSTPAGYEYTFTITKVVVPPETFGDYSFWFADALGTDVPAQHGWTVTVHSSAGNFTAGILPVTQTLNVGGSTAVTVGAVVTVFTAHLPLNGGRILLDFNGDGNRGGLSTVVID